MGVAAPLHLHTYHSLTPLTRPYTGALWYALTTLAKLLSYGPSGAIGFTTSPGLVNCHCLHNVSHAALYHTIPYHTRPNSTIPNISYRVTQISISFLKAAAKGALGGLIRSQPQSRGFKEELLSLVIQNILKHQKYFTIAFNALNQ